jgi:AcrR family transcriptional regulator
VLAPNKAWASSFLHPDDDQGKRRLAVLEAAYKVIAEMGFEGLRTRAVADLVGINVATLHYYFPSKQNLIEGLSVLIGAKFVTTHGPAPEPSGLAALDRLRQEFSDGRFYVVHRPDLLLVLQEFTLRGHRDSEVKRVVDQMRQHWRSEVAGIVRDGLSNGTFRPDLGFEHLLNLLMAILAGSPSVEPEQIEVLERQTEQWILSDGAKQFLMRNSGAENHGQEQF